MGLTRADLERDRMRQELAQTPLGPHLLSAAELEESLWQILETREAGEDCWVFGYGSLMWRPGFAYVDRRLALLRGWRRRLCVYSHVYRGTAERPGLVLGLDQGGACHGVAFRVEATDAFSPPARIV